MPWLAATLEVDAARVEAFSEALLEAGASAVSVDQVDAGRQSLQILMPVDADAGALIQRAALICGPRPAPDFALTTIADEDWVRRSQAQFEPLRLGERLWIGPTWCEPPAGVAAIVRLDPGLAFGTGSHATTKLVLGFLARTIKGGERVLDYGCGSGILAIAAAKLGASPVDAVDIDPDAVSTAAANAAANGVAMRTSLPEGLPPAQYDVVVSNILAQPLIVLAPLLAERTARGGAVALSGVLASQAVEVLAAYAPFFDARSVDEGDGWVLIEGMRA